MGVDSQVVERAGRKLVRGLVFTGIGLLLCGLSLGGLLVWLLMR